MLSPSFFLDSDRPSNPTSEQLLPISYTVRTSACPATFSNAKTRLISNQRRFQVACEHKSHVSFLLPHQITQTRKRSFPQHLKTAHYVFVRVDRVRKPLEPPYKGPFPVIAKRENYFTVRVQTARNTEDQNISISRLKPAFMDATCPSAPLNSSSPSPGSSPHENTAPQHDNGSNLRDNATTPQDNANATTPQTSQSEQPISPRRSERLRVRINPTPAIRLISPRKRKQDYNKPISRFLASGLITGFRITIAFSLSFFFLFILFITTTKKIFFPKTFSSKMGESCGDWHHPPLHAHMRSASKNRFPGFRVLRIRVAHPSPVQKQSLTH